MQHCMGHTAWAPEGPEGRNQAGPKSPHLEVFLWNYILVPTLLPGVRPAYTLLMIQATLRVGEKIPLEVWGHHSGEN